MSARHKILESKAYLDSRNRLPYLAKVSFAKQAKAAISKSMTINISYML